MNWNIISWIIWPTWFGYVTWNAYSNHKDIILLGIVGFMWFVVWKFEENETKAYKRESKFIKIS